MHYDKRASARKAVFTLNTSVKIAAAYIRVSTDDQIEYSPDAQLAEIKKYAAREGYLLPTEFIFMDEGITGRKTDKRDSFNRMIGIAKSTPKPFDAILLWKFSRFARNREDSVVYKSMLRKQLGIEVISITEPVGDDKMSVLIEALIEAMDEYYSINLAEEVRRGMTEKARRGGLQSIASFGYRADKEKNMLVPVPEEADIVRDIFSRFNHGAGLFPIAKHLNEQGIRTHRGNPFENRTVEYILRNPVYIGKLRWNPTGKSRRDFDNENIILANAAHEPIIDLETWDTAQTRMAEVKAKWGYKARPVYELKDWTSGLVRCASCGATLIFSAPHYYKCNNYVRGRCKTTQHISADTLKEAIIERMREDAESGIAPGHTIITIRNNSADELRRLENALEGIKRKKSRLHDAYLAGVDTVEEYAKYKKALDAESKEIHSQLTALKSAAEPQNTVKLLRDAILNVLAIIESETSTIAEKHEAIHGIVETCTFNKSDNLLKIAYRLTIQ